MWFSVLFIYCVNKPEKQYSVILWCIDAILIIQHPTYTVRCMDITVTSVASQTLQRRSQSDAICVYSIATLLDVL